MGNRITNSQEIIEKCTTKNISSILLMEISRLKKMLRQVFVSGRAIFHRDLKDCPTEQTEMAFFLIAQWHNVLFQNTNTFLEAYRRHACNFKEAVAEMLGSKVSHVSAQTRSQLYQERRCVLELESRKEGDH